ncbi:oxalate:formate antiporter-like isoform x1 [Plakobranchus ocellatus]|uniref:Oxalate:formate antiporter-like isoform x1 n=1 Tax=Plakobranchus ocellatus TaxID=259542 RepID=A0AAV4BD24_9GAST|nr:oxalate:formate antiporter-like isoform x1 [Plakobranchus ocellatus]
MQHNGEKLARCCSLIGAHFVMAPLSFVWNYGNLSAYMDSYIQFNCSPGCADADSQWIIALFVASVCPGIFISGPATKRLGLKWALILATISCNAAYIACAWTLQASMIGTAVLMGFVNGLSLGTVMCVSFTYVRLWAGQHENLFLATVTSASTALAILENQIITEYVNPDNLKANARVGNKAYFSQIQIIEKVPQIIIILGAISLGFQILGLVLVSSPQPSTFAASPNVGGKNPVSRETDIHLKGSKGGNRSTDTRGLHIKSNLHNRDARHDYRSNEERKDARALHEQPTEDRHKEGNQECDDFSSLPYSYKPLENLHTRSFKALWLYANALSYGLILKNSYYKRFGLLYIQDDRFLTLIGSLIPVVASIARIGFGVCMDKGILTVKDSIILSLSANSVLCSFWFFIPRLNGIAYMFLILGLASVHSLIFTISAAGALQMFGSDHFAENFAMTYTGLTTSAIFAAVVSPLLLHAIGWFWLFFTCSAFSLIALGFAVATAMGR